MSERVANVKAFLLRKENRYLWYSSILLIYLLGFTLVEALIPAEACKPTYIPLDDHIPFLEGFVVPYLLWFPMILAMGAYLAWFDHEGFKRYMVFLGLTLYTTLIPYVLFPNRQDLRVPVFSRDNLFTRLVAIIYSQDTNTNVCPSIHVIGSAAVAFAAWRCPRLRRRPVAVIAIWIFSAVVAVSTVFVKQHSALDIFVAIPLCVVAYPIAYRFMFRKANLRRIPAKS